MYFVVFAVQAIAKIPVNVQATFEMQRDETLRQSWVGSNFPATPCKFICREMLRKVEADVSL